MDIIHSNTYRYHISNKAKMQSLKLLTIKENLNNILLDQEDDIG